MTTGWASAGAHKKIADQKARANAAFTSLSTGLPNHSPSYTKAGNSAA
jgi:hypothetical protein